MIAAALLSATSSSLKSSTSVTTTTTTAAVTAMKTTEQQVRTLIPVTTSDGSKLFVSGPCILLKTQTPAPTVAQQMQALRPLLKADNNTNTTATNADNEKKTNDRNNNNNRKSNNNNNNSSVGTTTATNSTKTSLTANTENEPEPMRCKRRIDFSSLGLPRPQPATMARRNERERNRVKQVNLGFETLRQHVPQGRKNKKLSKVDTLKEAVKYIKYLQQLLEEADQDDDTAVTTTISDTITMVSRPTTTTTSIAAPSSEPVTSSHTSSAVMTSTNTTSVSAVDLFQLAARSADHSKSEDFRREPANDLASRSVEFPCEPVNNLASESVNFVCENVNNFIPADASPSMYKQNTAMCVDRHVDFADVTQLADFQDLRSVPQLTPTSNMDIGDNPTPNLVELTPAQLNFRTLQSRPTTTAAAGAMDIENIHVTVHPTMTDLSILPPVNATTDSSALACMDFGTSTSSSPDCSPLDLNSGHLPNFLVFRAEQSCRGGSDGSCPVSPSESSGASESQEDFLGVSEGETWQDFSADIAEWLCSKIDIDDPDVFV